LFRGGDEAEEEEPEAQGEGDADHEVGATVTFSGGGSHRLWLAVSGPTVTPTVASAAGPVATKLGEWEGQLRDDPTRLADHRPEGERLLADARGKLGDVQEEGNQAAQAEQQAAPEANPTPEEIAAADAQDVEAEQAEQTLAQVLGRLFELFGEVEADPRETYSAELGEMPLGAAAYASDQLGTLPPGVATTGWSEVKAWLRARPGFSGFMGENSRVGSGPGGTAQILKDAVTERVATITGPVPPKTRELSWPVRSRRSRAASLCTRPRALRSRRSCSPRRAAGPRRPRPERRCPGTTRTWRWSRTTSALLNRR